MDVGRVLVYEYRCKISRVVDGDTVDVDIIWVSVYGCIKNEYAFMV